MDKISTCHCGEDGYYSCVELREQLEVARKQLNEAVSAERPAIVAYLRKYRESLIDRSYEWGDDVTAQDALQRAAQRIERGEYAKERVEEQA